MVGFSECMEKGNSPANGCGAAARTRLRELGGELLQPGKVALEGGIIVGTILQARQVGGQFARRFGWNRVDHPVSLPLTLDHATRPQVAEVLRDFNLRLLQNFLEVTDTEGALAKKVQDPQSSAVAETLVNFD